jgi:prolyl oligopeptidase
LAYSARETGRDVSEIRFFDVYKREVLPDRLPSGLLRALVFSPDATGFYYSHEPIEAKRSSHGSVKWHEFGTFADHDHEIFRVNEIPDAHVSVLGSADGTLIYKVFSALDTYTVSIFIHRCQRGESPRKILDGVNGFFFPIGLIKSTLIALTNWRAPNWRVISINIDSAVPDEGKDLVAETGHYITDCSLVDSTLFISSIADLGGQIEGFDLNGRSQCLLPLPDRGTVRLFPRNVPTDTLLYEFSSFGIRPAIFQYQPRTSEHSVWWRSLATPLHTETKTRQLYFSSKDGTNVPVFLISRADQQEKNKLPTFLTAYGGFGKCITPKFAVYMHLLIEQGFLVAVAIIRGGAELGAHWHEAGKRHNRQRAFDDFIAAAEWLIESGYAAAGRIAIGGGSNAGLLVGASMTQRPDLFRAVLCQGPLLDMLRYHLFDHAALWVDEFGRAEDAEDFAALFSYSPYHNVVVGSCYPAVMLISGDADTRCNPMHARKMTARLQSATSSQRPILLDYRPTRGHIPVHALSDRIQSLADRLAFVCHELDVPVHKWGV